jgi:DNA-binding HxlR family transcriptional regulator
LTLSFSQGWAYNPVAVPNAPYRQFCPLARAVEIVGERWTLLVVRELLLRSQRFSDLLARLDGISTSVLADRLSRLEEAGLVRRIVLKQPVPAILYELTEDGRALEPAVFELVRWGYRRLLPARSGDRLDAEWVRLAMSACAQRTETRRSSFAVEVQDVGEGLTVYVSGGPRGTLVHGPPGTAHTIIRGDPETLLGIVSGALNPVEAHVGGRIEVRGDLSALPVFPRLFDVPALSGATPVHAEPVHERVPGPT